MPLSTTTKDFIKAATCAPDNSLAPRIPDGSGAKSFTQKFSRLTSVSVPAGKTLMIVCTPTLPLACYTVEYDTATGFIPTAGYFPTLQSVGQTYNETKTEFPEWESTISPIGVSNTKNIDAGRLVSLSAELQCTTNAFNQYGTVSCFKTPLALTVAPQILSGGAMGPNVLQVTGTNSLPSDNVSTGGYLAPVKDGAYAVSMNRNGGSGDFEYTEILDNVFYSESMNSTVTALAGSSDEMVFKGIPLLWDNHYDSIVFKISVPAGNNPAQTFILKNWVTVEMRTVYGSFMYGIAQDAPPRDPHAFRLYGAIEQNLPTAVPSKDNPDFWKTVLGIIKPLSGVASLIPGPIGTVARGVHAVSSVLSPDAPETKTKFQTGGYQVQLKNKNKGRRNRRNKRPQNQRYQPPGRQNQRMLT